MENSPPTDYRATHKFLWGIVEATREKYHQSQRAFDAIVNEVPSGIPPPDGVLRIEQVSRERKSDHQNYMKALRDFTDFLTKDRGRHI
jgi:hypothetical protein